VTDQVEVVRAHAATQLKNTASLETKTENLNRTVLNLTDESGGRLQQ
jgi:hypothetical protein